MSEAMKTSVEGKNLIIERVFHAPREVVFAAFSESESLASWWGPLGWETKNKQFEFVPGGVWHYCMTCSDENQGDFFGMESWGKSVFQEIIVPEKIVALDYFSDQDGDINPEAPSTQMTILFMDEEEKTKLIIRSQFQTPEDLQQVMEMGVVEGMSSQFVCLDEYLEK
ncbi:SRPBCC family protein [Niallia nealsonii]|uniref:ATPase n=1 Tax=Niallia nealsonii TaxID=115979 RepID=A0A2N0Z1Z0_9BACI|nr:SRPBCC domain-containing protein [Niallia nealsonii]PKG23526.1 ATPase [Niallia nealsonii]